MLELTELLNVASLLGIDILNAKIDGYTMNIPEDEADVAELDGCNVIDIYDKYQMLRFSTYTYAEGQLTYYYDRIPGWHEWIMVDQVTYSPFIFIMKQHGTYKNFKELIK